MDRDCDDLIDLGAASIETQGSMGPALDFVSTQPQAGVADE